MKSAKLQVADSYLMMLPTNFDYNPQTAETNTSQQIPKMPLPELKQAVMKEFLDLEKKLKDHDINVITINK